MNPELNGYWGTTTSTIDWCEENYVVSGYAAEFMNTISNAIFVILAVKLLSSSIRNKHGGIFVIVSIGILLIGIGSWLFHMTLRYEYQLLDELPMVYFTWIPFAYLLAVEVENKSRRILIYAIVLALMIFFTVTYLCFWDNPLLQQVVFGSLATFIIFRTITLTNKYVTDQSYRNFMFRLFFFAMFEIISGFVAWNIDTLLCSRWIQARRCIGLPLGLLLEWHAWWHVLTGLGVYHFVIFTQCLNMWYNKKQDLYEVRGFFGTAIPFDIVLKKGLQKKTA
ncbi:hypothetical protein FOA43_003922 [Brettanomyces nanus]|uniref:Alkaline ceramidase n=1 Tax=Eeniella nana TaxID=13502 RepID=A0A875S6I0_EENNA|nr:uncharacterized protein FOA43_003922 [Brettanomyces nanus]QPG76533.1 hypothetical protein FOA43_003922 [Brettanomyces nanus]